MINTSSAMFAKIKDKDFRKRFIAGQIRRAIPFQVRNLRAARKKTQDELAKLAKTSQEAISRIERGGGNLNINTLLRLADAFDVALVVRFEPIDKLINWVDDLSPESMAPLPSEEILERLEQKTASAKAAGAPRWATDLKGEQRKANPPTLEGKTDSRTQLATLPWKKSA